MECWEGSWAASCLWCCEYKWTLQGTPRVSEKHGTPCCNGRRSVCDSKPGHSACITSWALNWSYMMTVKKRIAQKWDLRFYFYDWLLSCFIPFGKVHLMVREAWPAVSGQNAPQRPGLQGGWPGLPVCWAWRRGCCWGNCSCRSPSPSWNGRCSCAAA